MNIEDIKTKNIMELGSGGGYACVGKKIIIYTHEKQDFSIEEISKINEFFKNLKR